MSDQFIIITIILSIFLISVFIENLNRFYRLLFNKKIKKYTTLNCGIFAWSGNDTKKFNKSKFDILGIYNDSRGGDGCGISKNSEIIKNLYKEKFYKDFLINKNYNNDLENGYILGHTRNSSKGLKNEDNTHPFGFGENKEKGFEFIGAHNGTLYNENDIGRKYKCDISKNDSSILLESIYNTGNFKVLSEYIGAAALVFTNTNEKNTIFAFRGESKTYETSKEVVEERPLYYYQESKNSLYISSTMESLVAITETQDDIEKIYEFEPNTVYQIKNGNVDKAVKFKITRNKCFQKNFTTTTSNYTNNNWKNNRISDDVKKITGRIRNRRSSTFDNKVFDISKETISNQERKQLGIVYENFKYKRNGHEVSGIYLNTKNGLIFLDEDLIDAYQVFFTEYLGKPYDNISGQFKKSMDEIKHQSFTIPFSPSIYTDSEKYPFIFILNGIRLTTSRDYSALLPYATENIPEFNNRVHWCSYYPVLNSKKEAIKKDDQINFLRFCPLNCNYIYTIVSGKVTSRKINNSENLLETFDLNLNILEADDYKSKVINLNNLNPQDEFDSLTEELKTKDIKELKESKKIKLFELESFNENEVSNEFISLFDKIEKFHVKYLNNKKESLNLIKDCNYSKKTIKAINKFEEELEKIKTDLLINN